MIKQSKFILMLLFTCVSFLQAQNNDRIVSGIVKDAQTGENLPGATVVIKNTMRGVVTNIDGEFKYKLFGEKINETVFIVSFIGYETTEAIVGDKSYLTVEVSPELNNIDEVVITSSYGTKKLKQDVVGSITSVNTRDLIVESAATSIDQLLEGQAAGLMIEGSEGTDAPAEIHIRGLGTLPSSSIGTSTQPLIIVDGVILTEEVEIDGSFETGGTNGEDASNPLSKIGIDDIESINILKDAAAVSLYGSDGANGVILITTKGGSIGKPRFSFNASSGVSLAMDEIIYMNGEQYNDVYNQYLYNTGDEIREWNGVSTDWHDLLNDNGFYQKYSLSMSGGVKDLTYRVSASYQNTQEPAINNTLDRFNSSISLGYNRDKLSLSLRFAPSYSIRNTPNSLSDYPVDPTLSVYESEGVYTPFDDYGNPLAVANQNIDKTKSLSFRNSLTLSYKIAKGLSFSTLLGTEVSDKSQDKFFSGENGTGESTNGLGRRFIINREGFSWNWNARLNYNKTFADDHNFDAVLGVETKLSRTSFDKETGSGFDVFDSPQAIEDAESISYSSDSDESTGRSGFTQLNYNYKKRYFLLVNSRIDQSSSFGDDNNTSINSAVGVSWHLNNEHFMDNVYWISHLKIRSSYGSSGNSRIGSYRAKGLYSVDDEGDDGYNGGPGYATPSTAPNPDLGWEKNYKFDAGIDLTTNFGLGITLDFYNDDIRDMIVSRDVPLETGFSSVQINGADMYNRGYELSLKYQIFDRPNFRWSSSFNISTLKNEITNLTTLGTSNSSSSSVYSTQVGTSSSALWGFNYVGVDPSTGRELYNVDGNIVDSNTLSQNYEYDDREIVGNTQPSVYGGLSNQFSIYKNLSLKVNLSYKIGGEMFVDDDQVDKYNIMSRSNMGINAYYEAWREPGDIADYGAITERGITTNSTKYLYSTSHIKLNTLSMAYRVPTGNMTFFDGLTFNLTGSNLFYWFFDKSPEGQNGIKEYYKTYSEMRSFTIGVNANF